MRLLLPLGEGWDEGFFITTGLALTLALSQREREFENDEWVIIVSNYYKNTLAEIIQRYRVSHHRGF